MSLHDPATPGTARHGAVLSPAARWATTASAIVVAALGGWFFVARAAAVRAGSEGAALFQEGATLEAFALLREAVDKAPLQSKPCVDLGDLAVSVIDDRAFQQAAGIAEPWSLARLAFLAYAEALDRQPGNPAAWAGMADLFKRARALGLAEGSFDLEHLGEEAGPLPAEEDRLAVASYLKAIRFEPNNFFHHAYLGSFYDDRGLRGEAVAAWARSVEIMPELSWHFYLPRERIPGDLFAAAREALSRSLETNPTVPPERILQNLGDLADRAGDTSFALQAYRRAAEEAKDPSLSLYLQGDLLFREKQCAGAEEALVAAIGPGTLQPNLLALAHTLAGRCRGMAGDAQGAVDHLERARRLNAGAWYIAADLGAAHEKMGHIRKAEAEYRAAIRLAPERASVYAALIGMYRRNREISKAIPLAEKLVDLFPEDQVFMDQLEALYRDLGMPEAGGS